MSLYETSTEILTNDVYRCDQRCDLGPGWKLSTGHVPSPYCPGHRVGLGTNDINDDTNMERLTDGSNQHANR